MVVRLRLQRFGHRNLPFYRIVVADARAPRDGRFIERVSHIRFCFDLVWLIQFIVIQLGTYNPIPNKDNVKEVTANVERCHYWMSVGAQPSDRVAWLLGKLGVIPEPPQRKSIQSAVPKFMREAVAAPVKVTAAGGKK